jgi:hypothetical protein
MSRFVRRHRDVMAGLSLAVLACFLPLTLSASTAVVTPPLTIPCINLMPFNKIQVALDYVPAGSTIYICPGTYPEQITITKRVTLIGVGANGLSGSAASGANNPVIVSPTKGVVANASDLSDGSPIAAQVAVLAPAGTVNISNLTVDGSNNGLNSCATDLVGIYYQNVSGIVNHVATRFQELPPADFGCQDGLAIFVQSGYSSGGTAAVTIENSSVHDYDKNGITADGSGTVAAITANYVVGIGPTSLIAQNGIQVSDGASGKVTSNTVTDDIYINPPDCTTSNSCTSATGILLYDSGGTSAKPLAVTSNTVSNTQGAIIAYGDPSGTADYNNVSTNKVTTSPAAGPYLLDGIDLCSNNNTATSNTVFNSSGSGVHIDSSCTESTGTTGNNTTVTNNTINEACAGVLTGTGSSPAPTGTVTYNVVQTIASGDSCPAGNSERFRGRLKPQPKRH